MIFQETATPGPGLSGKEIDLRYNGDVPDGQRLEIKIGGQRAKSDLLDWALIPISNYANSPYTAVFSLLARPQSETEEKFEWAQRSSGKRVFWNQVHPDLKDTLVGFNALLVDAMFLNGDPGSTRQYTQGLKPKVTGWNDAAYDEVQSATAAHKLRKLLDHKEWSTYIFNDLGSAFNFAIQGENLVISGQNPTYHFFDVFLGSADSNDELTESFRDLTKDGAVLRVLNPAVYDTANRTAQWAAFFRYVKANYPTKWTAYLLSLDHAANVLAIETPVAWARVLK